MLKRGILVIFGANVFSLIFSLLTNFLLPKYLTIEAYAAIKSFQLYISYAGLLHFGFVDGMYLRYGGNTPDVLEPRKVKDDVHTMQVFQMAVTAVCALLSFLLKDAIWLCFSVALLPLNMAAYFKLLYQATGEFRKYGIVTNVTTVLTFAVNMLLFLAETRGNGLVYIGAYILVDVVLWLWMEWWTRKAFYPGRFRGHFSWRQLTEHIRDGFLLMLGNLSNVFFTGMDRWFVKLLMDTAAFARYSFAVSVENFLNVAITPVSITFYNYFCRERNEEKIRVLQRAVVVMALVLPAAAFPIKFILEHFLGKYMASSNVIFLLFSAQTYIILNKCIYVNLYKSRRKQRLYFVRLLSVLAVGAVLNGACYFLCRSMDAFALATLLSNGIWFLLSMWDFRGFRFSLGETLALFVETGLFLFAGLRFHAVYGCLLYAACTAVMLLTWLRRDAAALYTVLRKDI